MMLDQRDIIAIAEAVVALLPAQQDAYSVKQAAGRLSISERSARNAVARGELPSVLIGGRRVIPAEAIADLLAPPEAQS